MFEVSDSNKANLKKRPFKTLASLRSNNRMPDTQTKERAASAASRLHTLDAFPAGVLERDRTGESHWATAISCFAVMPGDAEGRATMFKPAGDPGSQGLPSFCESCKNGSRSDPVRPLAGLAMIAACSQEQAPRGVDRKRCDAPRL